MIRFALLIVLLVGLAGCSGLHWRPFFLGSDDTEGYWLPLTVSLKLDPSVTQAGLQYTDACNQPQTLPLGDRFATSLTRQIGMAFEKVLPEPAVSQSGQPVIPDGVVQVTLGFKELLLFIPRHETNNYTASVSLGATVTYTDASGAVLYTKNLRTDARGNVDTDRDKCEVQGLAGLANQAMTTLAQGLKKHLGTSVKLQQVASQRKRGQPRVASAAPPAGSAPSAASEAVGAPAVVPGQTPSSDGAAAGPVTLSFRAMLRDENQDHVLESGERVTVEVEVKNAGAGLARSVIAALSGSPELVQVLANPISIGDLAPGETKRVEVSGRLPPVSGVQQAELIIAVAASSATSGQPRPKKFLVALRPTLTQQLEVLSVDVDQVPSPVRGYQQRKAVGIAIGVGAFRDPEVPGVKFAARDADIMGKYFRTVGGVSAKRIKVMMDAHVLKEDLVEVFEEWLPEQAEPEGLVYVFFSGRAVVDPATGAVFLLPHEGNPGAPLRAFSLRRLHAALSRLPVKHAILLLDVTLMIPPNATQGEVKEPVWGTPGTGDGKLVQMIGVTKTQLTHQYEYGKHGLFTYYLLKGLGGEADRDHNGEVAVGELFEYSRERVSQTAMAEFGNEQEPACVPALDPTAKAWNLPLTRVK
jgi:hypothetical protein